MSCCDRGHVHSMLQTTLRSVIVLSFFLRWAKDEEKCSKRIVASSGAQPECVHWGVHVYCCKEWINYDWLERRIISIVIDLFLVTCSLRCCRHWARRLMAFALVQPTRYEYCSTFVAQWGLNRGRMTLTANVGEILFLQLFFLLSLLGCLIC